MLGLNLWKLIGGGVAVSVLVGSCVARDVSIKSAGRKEERAETRKATADASKSAVQKQAAVPVSGAARRLRSEFCPDCPKP